jgi:hypothetical protein
LRTLSLAPENILEENGYDRLRIDAGFNGNSTRHHSNTLHYSGQGHWQRPHNHQQHLLAILPFLHNCFIPKLPRIQHQIHSAHSGRKQDLTPTNQNTRSRTRQHPISCILVPHHDRAHGNHFYCLKSTNNKKFTDLDPFYHPHFAFPFGLPPCRIVAAAPNV